MFGLTLFGTKVVLCSSESDRAFIYRLCLARRPGVWLQDRQLRGISKVGTMHETYYYVAKMRSMQIESKSSCTIRRFSTMLEFSRWQARIHNIPISAARTLVRFEENDASIFDMCNEWEA